MSKKYLSLLLLVLFVPTTFPQTQNPNSNISDIPAVGIVKDISDSTLLDIIQRQTFRYFWHNAHTVSGLARERSNAIRGEYFWDYADEAYGSPNFSKNILDTNVCAIGGSGFGIMATIVAVNRGWIGRDTAVGRLIQITDFLIKADSYHGIFPHWMHGATGKTIPFGYLDDGADIVETSYMLMGLLCAREYFNGSNEREIYLRSRIKMIWEHANFNWHTRDGNERLYWHWSPKNDWDMNFPIWGWNECLITYIVASSSPYHSISNEVYENNWVKSDSYFNGKTYYGYKLPLGFEYGGPLFFAHYTFMGIDPRGLKDDNTDYWEQNLNHTLINRQYCIENPKKFKGYGENCWGLTASDSYEGYVAHSPLEDFGVISPTAAISSMPYTPEYSMQALKHFYYDLGDKIWSDYGFVDAFSIDKDWYANSHLAIDQGPIVVMIENYRTGLLWKLFMNIPEIQNGLKKLGFDSPWLK
ncbi:MAG: glucoamylase family protein [Bacteroidota bacterium]